MDLVVGGLHSRKCNREPFFGVVLVGAHNFGKLVYVGRVGSGFSEKELDAITRSFKLTSKSPFLNSQSAPGVIWLKPEMVMEVTAMEVAHDGHLEAPVSIRIRDDKEPQDCSFGAPGSRKIELLLFQSKI